MCENILLKSHLKIIIASIIIFFSKVLKEVESNHPNQFSICSLSPEAKRCFCFDVNFSNACIKYKYFTKRKKTCSRR